MLYRQTSVLPTSSPKWCVCHTPARYSPENNYLTTQKWIIAKSYTLQNCFQIQFYKNFYNFMGCRLVAHWSFVNKTFWNTSWLQLSLKKHKRNTYLWILNCQISLLLRYCLARRLRLLKKSSYSLNLNITGRHLVLLGCDQCSIFRDERYQSDCPKNAIHLLGIC